MILCRVPLRVSFFGGGTDYPGWYHEHGGCVLSTTIDKFCFVTSRYLPPFFEHRYRITYSKIEHTKTLDDILHPAIREAIRLSGILEGLEIRYDADLPARTGLGSSSSFVVGLLHSLYALRGTEISPDQLAREAIRVEQVMLGEAVGSQDQVSAAFGGFNWIEFDQKQEFLVSPISASSDRIHELNNHMLLFYTGISRFASEVAVEQIQRIDKNTSQLYEMMALAKKARSIIEGTGSLLEFGKLLDLTWSLKRSLSTKISNSLVDDMYAIAKREGALGGKLLGAGGGGFLLIFAEPAAHSRIKKALSDFLAIQFRFEKQGSHLLYVHRDS